MWLVPLCLLVLLLGSFFLYTAQYYHAGEAAKAAMIPDDTVQVKKTEMGWLFDGPSEGDALIFYPGAKVEDTRRSCTIWPGKEWMSFWSPCPSAWRFSG